MFNFSIKIIKYQDIHRKLRNFLIICKNPKIFKGFFVKTLNILAKKLYKYIIPHNQWGIKMNLPLFSAIFSIAFTVTIGILMIVAFVTGFDKAVHIVGAVVVGALISLPVAMIVTKKASALTSDDNPSSKA